MNRRQRREVLSEDVYSSTLESIVQRDYFPDLPLLQRQAALLERRAVGDIAGVVRIRNASRRMQKHEESLADQEEADERDIEGALRKKPRPLHRENVTGFHYRVLSEDNHEFDDTQEASIKHKRRLLQEAFREPGKSRANTDGGPKQETPLLASDLFNASPHRILASQCKDSASDRSSLFFAPQREGGTPPGEKEQKMSQLAGFRKNSTDAALMPPPKAVSSATDLRSASVPCNQPSKEKSAESRQSMVEYLPRKLTGKRILPAQTRFSCYDNELNTIQKKSHFEADDVLSMTECSTDESSATTDLDEPFAGTISQQRLARAKRKRLESDCLVAMTPTFACGDSSPIVTWGTVSSTPLVVGVGWKMHQNSYSFPPPNQKEETARRLEEKRNVKPKAPKKRKNKRTVDRRESSLTPAAHALLHNSSSGGFRSQQAFGSSLRTMDTPRGTNGKLRSSGNRVVALSRTPLSSAKESDQTDPTTTIEGGKSANVTDGLLRFANTP